VAAVAVVVVVIFCLLASLSKKLQHIWFAT
jgi:hypothetical protein